MRYQQSRPARGFTLIELLIVITIIGILIGFILVAAADGVRRAEEKATLALITKLEIGLSERLEAILVKRADVYPFHILFAGVLPAGGTMIRSNQREQVLAQFDLVRSELPDFFVPQVNNQGLPTDGHYAFNFGAQKGVPLPGLTTFPPNAPSAGDWSVPLGSFAGGNNNQAVLYSTVYTLMALPNTTPIPPPLPTTGVYGATWGAMAGIHKNIGYLPAGYDGIDNNGNGLVDDWFEGVGASNAATVTQHILSHKHNTARSEMLYALLVEGQGALGSVFAPDEFTAREVADTDGDGLPEFIDAWGQPLQFYRWPIFYNPDFFNTVNTVNVTGSTVGTTANVSPANYIQKGLAQYSGLVEPRQLDSLDPGQQLMSPSWFDGNVNTTSTGFPSPVNSNNASSGVGAFEAFFHYLRDPYWAKPLPPAPPPPVWDRSGAYPRRAYYSRPLILSSGPDKLLGVANFGSSLNQTPNIPPVSIIFAYESPASPTWTVPPFTASPIGGPLGILADDPTGALSTNAVDDISNFSLSSAGGGVK